MLNNLTSELAKTVNIFDPNGYVANYVEIINEDRAYKEIKKGIIGFRKKVKVFEYDNSFYCVHKGKDLTSYFDASKNKFILVVHGRQGDVELDVKFEYGKQMLTDTNTRKECIDNIMNRMGNMLEREIDRLKKSN